MKKTRKPLVKTMVRQVPDDFHALLLCNAMESVGGRPFSVVFAAAYKTAHFPHYEIGAAWHVFGQVGDIDAVDQAYADLLNEMLNPPDRPGGEE